ncbi:MAG: DUF362 domain-containing protein [Spirochaetaceae bacterium]|nr:MAG: DUF362 domain-containing protein [Spirochaetaceae bacterium]
MNSRDLAVAYGTDACRLVLNLLQAMDIGSEVGSKTKVLLKPNLVMAREASSGITTHAEVAEGVIRYLLDAGVQKITIAESSWTGGDTRRAYRVCGYTDLADKYGKFGVDLLDLKVDSVHSLEVQGVRFKVFRSVLATDYFVNLPVLKGHGGTKLTCALKNLKGCIPDSEKRRYHAEGLHKPIAQLNTLIHQDLVIVDGLCGDPSSETGGNPLAMDRVIMGKDPVLVDSYVAELMGYRPEMIEHIAMAAQLGIGSTDTSHARIREFGEPRFRKIPQPDTSRLQRLRGYIADRQACSACYGSTLYALQRLEESRRLNTLRDKICVGQGYRGVRLEGSGIGACTRGLSNYVDGCPPTARNIIEFLESSVSGRFDA